MGGELSGGCVRTVIASFIVILLIHLFFFIFLHTYSSLFRIYEKAREVTQMIVDEYELSPEELRRYLDDLYN